MQGLQIIRPHQRNLRTGLLEDVQIFNSYSTQVKFFKHDPKEVYIEKISVQEANTFEKKVK